jgi:ABC-2 type transport system permease protein
VLVRSGLALVVYAVIGVGLGALFPQPGGRHRGVADPPLRRGTDHPVDPGDGRGLRATAGGAFEAMTATFQGPDLPTAWQSGLLLLGYGLLAAILGTLLAVRRDVA